MRILILVATTVFCATPIGAKDVRVSVSGFSRDSTPSTYTLIPDTSINASSLEFQAYAQFLNRILSAKGWTMAKELKAEISILVSYGIGEPKDHQFSYSIPQYNAGSAYVPGTVTWLPIDADYTSYYRWLRLRAVRAVGSSAPSEIWTMEATSTGTSDDLREIFPYLVLASAPYIANDTEKAVRVKIKMDGKEMRLFKAAGR